MTGSEREVGGGERREKADEGRTVGEERGREGGTEREISIILVHGGIKWDFGDTAVL